MEDSVFSFIAPFDDDVNVRLYDTLNDACTPKEQLTWSAALLCCSVDEAVGLLSKQVMHKKDLDCSPFFFMISSVRVAALIRKSCCMLCARRGTQTKQAHPTTRLR
jgi:hypothetical protein